MNTLNTTPTNFLEHLSHLTQIWCKEQKVLLHPEIEGETFTQVRFFTNDLSVLPIFIQNIISKLNTDYDFEINPSIFFNCDDRNYLIVTDIIEYI